MALINPVDITRLANLVPTDMRFDPSSYMTEDQTAVAAVAVTLQLTEEQVNSLYSIRLEHFNKVLLLLDERSKLCGDIFKFFRDRANFLSHFKLSSTLFELDPSLTLYGFGSYAVTRRYIAYTMEQLKNNIRQENEMVDSATSLFYSHLTTYQMYVT